MFRRGRNRPTRDDAFAEVFAALARVYGAAARLKPHWDADWSERSVVELPPRFLFGDDIARDAAHDLRFATALLQRNRWKSKVLPIFDTVDREAWDAFQHEARSLPLLLLDIADTRIDLIAGDERDWILNAVEQLDDTTRRLLVAERENTPLSTIVAESTYGTLYIAIQLSDRLIERRKFEADQRS
jgi:hypothetical protein